MRKKRIQQTLQALKEAFQTAGTPISEATVDFATQIVTTARFQRLFIKRPEQLAIASVLAGALYNASKNDDPEEKWNRSLEKLKKELPYMLRSGFQSGVKDLVKGLPKRPGTGRKELLSSKQQKEACKLVSKYHHNGCSKRKAYERIAAEMNCSPRTIQRAWMERPKRVSEVRNRI